jgi:uncharacterized protein (DUF302 family)
MESYSAAMPFDEVLGRLRKVLSRPGFEILRECDVGSRIRSRSGSESAPQCRILYVTDLELERHLDTRSAALCLPIPLVLRDRDDCVTILVPAELT